jgi:hypothetical protein
MLYFRCKKCEYFLWHYSDSSNHCAYRARKRGRTFRGLRGWRSLGTFLFVALQMTRGLAFPSDRCKNCELHLRAPLP